MDWDELDIEEITERLADIYELLAKGLTAFPSPIVLPPITMMSSAVSMVDAVTEALSWLALARDNETAPHYEDAYQSVCMWLAVFDVLTAYCATDDNSHFPAAFECLDLAERHARAVITADPTRRFG